MRQVHKAWLAPAVLLLATAGCSCPPLDTPVAAAPVIRQMQLGAVGPGRTLRWTCAPGRVCVEQIASGDPVMKSVSAPVGSTVMVKVAGRGGLPPSCWIADGDGHSTFVEDSGEDAARCEYRVSE